MQQDSLKIECDELREIAEQNPNEAAIIVEMLIEAEEELCSGQEAA